MSRADEIFQQNCRDILDHGVWDTDQAVRPRWDDGYGNFLCTLTNFLLGNASIANFRSKSKGNPESGRRKNGQKGGRSTGNSY